MEPLFFGESDSALYGVYHPPESTQVRSDAVLLCYPAGHEYMRIHRAFRQLAGALNAKGFHVLRFDYFGTGDSAGDQAEIMMERWLQDAEAAAEELLSISGCRKLSVVGLRLGALIASQLAAKVKAVKRLVLWEPLLEGEAFVREMLQHIEDHGTSLANFSDDSNTLHFNGYAFTEHALNSIKSVDFASIDWANQPDVFTLTSRDDLDVNAINASLPDNQRRFDVKTMPQNVDWNVLDEVGGIYLPLGDLQSIGDWLGERV